MPNHVMNVVTFNGNNKKLQEILEDIRGECMNFGTVLNVEIPRPDRATSFASLSVGKVFVKFATIIL